jgi:hypothetical protein
MSFFTPFLFVFYLQVMPPPPPTMNGGGDYWSGNTNTRRNGNSTDLDWGFFDLFGAINGQVDGRRAIGGYRNINQIVSAIENGWITDLSFLEWLTVLQYSVTSSSELFERACEEARNSDANGDTAANFYNCPVNAPISKELSLIVILSFLIIFYHYNRKGFCLENQKM